jgi:hypothetical protein
MKDIMKLENNMKELDLFELNEISGGGSVFKWFGKVYAAFLNTIEESDLKYYSSGTYPGHLNNI